MTSGKIGKIYVVVTNAVRTALITDIGHGHGHVSKKEYLYGKGKIGVIEPNISKFYSNFDSYCKKYGKPKIFPASLASGLMDGELAEMSYTHHRENIPVRFYNLEKRLFDEKVAKDFTKKSEYTRALEIPNDSMTERNNYSFLGMFRWGEIEAVNGRRFKDVFKGVKGIYRRHRFTQGENFNNDFGTQFEELRKPVLMRDVSKIPFEVSLFKVSKGEFIGKMIATINFEKRTQRPLDYRRMRSNIATRHAKP